MSQLLVVDSDVVGKIVAACLELDKRGIVQSVPRCEQTASGLYKQDI
jgi:hypothetical protein